MAVSTLITTSERKKAQAKRLSKRMCEFMLTHKPDALVPITAIDYDGDASSKGHAFELEAAGDYEFPAFGFEVLIDDRHNGGDMAQTIVDQLFAIASAYMEVAKRNARRLNREPKKIDYRWEESQPENDWELEEWSENYNRIRRPAPKVANRKGSTDVHEAGRVKQVLPNGDLIVDGTDLYRVVKDGKVCDELVTRHMAAYGAWIADDCGREQSATYVSYAELAAK